MDPKLCSNCPFISYLAYVEEHRKTYRLIRKPEKLTDFKKCQLLRGLQKQRHMHCQSCPFLKETETMERYLIAKAQR